MSGIYHVDSSRYVHPMETSHTISLITLLVKLKVHTRSTYSGNLIRVSYPGGIHSGVIKVQHSVDGGVNWFDA